MDVSVVVVGTDIVVGLGGIVVAFDFESIMCPIGHFYLWKDPLCVLPPCAVLWVDTNSSGVVCKFVECTILGRYLVMSVPMCYWSVHLCLLYCIVRSELSGQDETKVLKNGMAPSVIGVCGELCVRVNGFFVLYKLMTLFCLFGDKAVIHIPKP